MVASQFPCSDNCLYSVSAVQLELLSFVNRRLVLTRQQQTQSIRGPSLLSLRLLRATCLFSSCFRKFLDFKINFQTKNTYVLQSPQGSLPSPIISLISISPSGSCHWPGFTHPSRTSRVPTVGFLEIEYSVSSREKFLSLLHFIQNIKSIFSKLLAMNVSHK